MILAAGLTPAWQQIVLLDAFHPGEVNCAREVHWCASGKVLNAGVALHHLGAESLTLTLAGGEHLPAMDRELAALGVPRRWIESRVPTRVCTTILDTTGGSTTELDVRGTALRRRRGGKRGATSARPARSPPRGAACRPHRGGEGIMDGRRVAA